MKKIVSVTNVGDVNFLKYTDEEKSSVIIIGSDQLPDICDDSKKETLNLELDTEALEWLNELSHKIEVSKDELIESILRYELENFKSN